jgi:hypothetical protein
LTISLPLNLIQTPTLTLTLTLGGIVLAQAATVFYDTLERTYPNFPDIKEVKLSEKELNFWLDIRAHMDVSPLTVNENTSIHRVYRLGLRLGLSSDFPL